MTPGTATRHSPVRPADRLQRLFVISEPWGDALITNVTPMTPTTPTTPHTALHRPRTITLRARQLAVGLALVMAAAACSSGSGTDVAPESTTSVAPSGTPVAFDFSYETVPEGNTTQTIDDDGDLQFGNINFAGSGTLGDDPVEVTLQAHVLFRDGTGPSGGSLALTDPNGDVLVLELDSRAKRVGDGAKVDGEFTVAGGTGRFAGVTGGGSGTGERNASLGAAVRWSVELVLDGL